VVGGEDMSKGSRKSANLLKGTYTPDFKCPRTFYEVKGRWTDIGLAKFNAFVSQYPKLKIKVIDRSWLTGKGLL